MSLTDTDYTEFIEQKLKPHPVGRTTSDLEEALPENASEESLRNRLQKLEKKGKVKKIGEKWRWMKFG
jgi:DNA-binding Lrp family transcriptional regulator